jgi:iron complex transport system substrate-binding protein
MKKYLLFILPGMLLASCGRFENKDNEKNHPERIISISKQYSEFIFALGAQKNLVAVDISSTYPAAVKKLPTVGYHRALSAESILANTPTLILEDGPESMGPEHVVRQLEQLKIPMKSFKIKATNIDSTKLLLKEIGAYFKKDAAADSLCKKLDADMKIALEKAKNYTDTPKVLIIHYGQANNVYLIVSKKTGAGNLIKWAGGKMAIDPKGMRQLSAEVVAKSDPDVIILTDFGYDKLGGSPEKIGELPGVSSTKAFKNKRIYRFEEHDLLYMGPRTGENVIKLQKIIHQHEPVQ